MFKRQKIMKFSRDAPYPDSLVNGFPAHAVILFQSSILRSMIEYSDHIRKNNTGQVIIDLPFSRNLVDKALDFMYNGDDNGINDNGKIANGNDINDIGNYGNDDGNDNGNNNINENKSEGKLTLQHYQILDYLDLMNQDILRSMIIRSLNNLEEFRTFLNNNKIQIKINDTHPDNIDYAIVILYDHKRFKEVFKSIIVIMLDATNLDNDIYQFWADVLMCRILTDYYIDHNYKYRMWYHAIINISNNKVTHCNGNFYDKFKILSNNIDTSFLSYYKHDDKTTHINDIMRIVGFDLKLELETE